MQMSAGRADHARRSNGTTTLTRRAAHRPERLVSLNRTSFLIGMAAGLTIAMVLFPPFLSVSGTEYAFVASGPAWARQLGRLDGEPGLVAARIHWLALAAQLAFVWTLTGLLGWLLGRTGSNTLRR